MKSAADERRGSQSQHAVMSVGGLTRRPAQAPKTRQSLVSLTAECAYSFDEQMEERDGNNDRRPLLARCLRCRAALPGIPLKSTSRIIAMLKCFRKIQSSNKSGGSNPMIETIYSNFQRIWPTGDGNGKSSGRTTSAADALVTFDATSSMEFKIVLPHDLPQSIAIPGGSIYYTLQVQANLNRMTDTSSDEVVYSEELVVEIPPPEAAYSSSRLPRRIANGVIGQAQDHFGILITPDISLHVSVPREINYSKHMHSVFKIHIKLMPHPPEAKLPGIAKLEWKLRQTTNLGSVQLDGENASRRIGISTADIASGQILLLAGKQQTGDEAMMGSRKDQYLYIALPENSLSLLPQYYGNKYLEIVHILEVALFPANETTKNSTFSKSFFNFSKNFGRKRDSKKQSWTAEIPIKITFDATELAQIPPLQNLSHGPARLTIAAA